MLGMRQPPADDADDATPRRRRHNAVMPTTHI